MNEQYKLLSVSRSLLFLRPNHGSQTQKKETFRLALTGVRDSLFSTIRAHEVRRLKLIYFLSVYGDDEQQKTKQDA